MLPGAKMVTLPVMPSGTTNFLPVILPTIWVTKRMSACSKLNCTRGAAGAASGAANAGAKMGAAGAEGAAAAGATSSAQPAGANPAANAHAIPRRHGLRIFIAIFLARSCG